MTAPAFPTPSSTATSAPDLRGPADRRAGRRRHAVRFAGVALAAGTLLGGLAQAAHAETPPAPKPTMPLAANPPGPFLDLPVAPAPIGPNTGKVTDVHTAPGGTWADVTFRSNKATVIVQLSTTKPHLENGRYTMGPVSPVLLHGTPTPGGAGSLAVEASYDYKLSPESLHPATTYHVLFTVNGHTGQQPVQATSSFTTKTRAVRMTPLKIHVSNDSDKGGNAGEIRFGARIAPDGDPTAATNWGGWTSEHSLDSGDDLDLSKSGIGHTVTTKADTVVVQVQGRENDVQGYDWDCAIQGGPRAPMQYSDHCYDESFAQAYVGLPTGRFSGAHKQIVDALVGHSPALQFQAQVLVETWYV